VRRRALIPSAALALAAVALAGCSSDPDVTTSAGGGAKLKVVATTTQVADFVRNVGGDRVELTQLLKPNVDPHDYEASPADVQAIADADVVVKNGVGLEAFLDDAISSAGFSGQVVDASKGVTIRQGNGEEEEKEGDPHIWHDPRNATIMVRNIADGLGAEDPTDKPAYEANATAYTAKIDTLDKDIARQIGALPAAQRKLVTNHDAFGYYVQRYGLQFVGSIIPSFDTSAELSGKDLSDLVAKIRTTGVKAIFSESSLPPKTADTVGREAGVTVVGGEDALYGDTLGPAGSDGDTYLKMEEHNTKTIVGALGG
jgi:zinc/manganese transport system substrate-binding protein/manganese/iron transport system substrate-binding protein